MRLRTVFVTLLVSVLLGPLSGAASPPPPPDLVAAVVTSPGVSLLAWTPVTGAQEYEVYGQTSTGLVPLFATSETATVVQGSYQTFAVASIADGSPGSPTYVTAGTCVYPNFDDVPPSVRVDSCGASGPIPSLWIHAP